METDSSTLIAACPPDFFNSLQVPFNPPALPKSREEALFFLSTGGRNCLGDLLALLDEYLMDLKASDGFPKRKIVVECFTFVAGEGLIPFEVCSMQFDLSQYFEGFSNLGVWLSKTCGILSTESTSGDSKMGRCTDVQWMTEFANNTAAQRNIDIITLFRKSLRDMVDWANWRWDTCVYWDLVLMRLRTEAELNEKQYAGNFVLRDVNSQADRRELYNSLENEGFFDVKFERYISEDESELIENKYLRGEINEFRDYLLSTNPMTIKEVYAAIKEEPRQSLLLTDVRQRTEKNAIKGKSAEISSEKTLDLSALLKNKTKYFTEDLFVWFFLAMADMNVAKKSNAQVGIGKIIAKEIITRAGELRGTTFPTTDSQARSATAIKDVVNLHMGSVTLPKRTYNLTDEQINALIAFMKKIPEIRKNFAKCENLQLFIKNQLT